MTVGATHIAFLNFSKNLGPATIIRGHFCYRINFLCASSVVKFQNYRITLTTIYTGMLK